MVPVSAVLSLGLVCVYFCGHDKRGQPNGYGRGAGGRESPSQGLVIDREFSPGQRLELIAARHSSSH